MDAATISILVERLNKILDYKKMNLITVHDCFATNANHVELIHFHVRASFFKLYQDQEFVNHFHSFLIQYLINRGFKTNEDKTVLILDNTNINIPHKPVFEKSFNLFKNLFGSKYFLI